MASKNNSSSNITNSASSEQQDKEAPSMRFPKRMAIAMGTFLFLYLIALVTQGGVLPTKDAATAQPSVVGDNSKPDTSIGRAEDQREQDGEREGVLGHAEEEQWHQHSNDIVNFNPNIKLPNQGRHGGEMVCYSKLVVTSESSCCT